MPTSWKLNQFPVMQAIAEAIFNHKPHCDLPNGTRLYTKSFKGRLFAIDYQGRRFVEQNPNTNSAYAEKARRGAKILWVIKTHQRAIDASGKEHWVPCPNEWLGRIEDSTIYKK